MICLGVKQHLEWIDRDTLLMTSNPLSRGFGIDRGSRQCRRPLYWRYLFNGNFGNYFKILNITNKFDLIQYVHPYYYMEFRPTIL